MRKSGASYPWLSLLLLLLVVGILLASASASASTSGNCVAKESTSTTQVVADHSHPSKKKEEAFSQKGTGTTCDSNSKKREGSDDGDEDIDNSDIEREMMAPYPSRFDFPGLLENDEEDLTSDLWDEVLASPKIKIDENGIDYGISPQIMKLCLVHHENKYSTHYLPKPRPGLMVLLQNVVVADYRIGKLSLLPGIASTQIGNVLFELSLNGDKNNAPIFSEIFNIQSSTDLINTLVQLENWRSKISSEIIPKPEISVIHLSRAQFFKILDESSDPSLFASSSLFNSEEQATNSGSRFQELLQQRVEHLTKPGPLLYPFVESTVRKHLQTFFAEATFLLNVSRYRISATPLESNLHYQPYVSDLQFGEQIWIAAHLSPYSNGDALFNQERFLQGFFDAVGNTTKADLFMRKNPNSVIESRIWWLHQNPSNSERLLHCLLSEEDIIKINFNEINKIGSLYTISLPIQPLDHFLRNIQHWALIDTSLEHKANVNMNPYNSLHPIAVVASAFVNGTSTPHKVLFSKSHCVTNSLPNPKTLLFMSRLTYLSIGFLLLFSTFIMYLFCGWFLYLMNTGNQQHSLSPNGFVRLYPTSMTLYFMYIWPPRYPNDLYQNNRSRRRRRSSGVSNTGFNAAAVRNLSASAEHHSSSVDVAVVSTGSTSTSSAPSSFYHRTDSADRDRDAPSTPSADTANNFHLFSSIHDRELREADSIAWT